VQKQNGKYYRLEFQNLSKTLNYKNLNTIDKKCFLQRIVNVGNQSALKYHKRKILFLFFILVIY